MLTESLVEAFRTRLEALGFDLADLRIGGTPNRPLVQVRIDCPPRNVTVEDCSRVSRALEQWLDADGGSGGGGGGGGPLGNRYVLEVSSPGIERPVRWHRHWLQFVGRDVNVKLAGLGRVRARIVAVPDQDTVTCLIPGHHRPGRELVSDLIAVEAGALVFSVQGRCAYETTFAYSSEQ